MNCTIGMSLTRFEDPLPGVFRSMESTGGLTRTRRHSKTCIDNWPLRMTRIPVQTPSTRALAFPASLARDG